jgi:ketosteroid isomerase-like protein
MKAVVLVLGGLFLAQANDIRQLERQRADAVRAGVGLERFYAPDCFGINRAGDRSDLKAVLAVKADPTYVVSDIDVRTYANSAIAVGAQRVDGGVAMRFLRVWVTHPDGWKLVAFHGTPVASDTSYTGAPSSIVATPRASPVGPPDRTVLAVESTLLRLEAENQDAEARALKTNGSIFVRHTGTVAATFEDSKANPLKNEIVSWDRVQSYGDIAVVQGTLLWTDVNGYSPGQLRFTRVWVKQDGAWKLAAEQHTSIGS